MIRIRKGTQGNGVSRRGLKAQGMVEFALILPIILVTLFMLVELARLFHAWMAIENGARFGVRYAVTGEFDPSHCPGGVCSDETEEKDARLDSIDAAANAGSASILRDFAASDVTENGFFKVTVCDPDLLIDPSTPTEQFECIGGEYPGDPGQSVTVVVEFTHPIITPIISGIAPNLHISAEREAVVETFRVVQAGGGAPGALPPPPEPPEEPPTPPPPPDPCENLILGPMFLVNESADYDDRVWMLGFSLYNNNSFDGDISWLSIDWTRPDDLDLASWKYRPEGLNPPPIVLPGAKTGPVMGFNLPFPSRPQEAMPWMSGKFCVNNDDGCQAKASTPKIQPGNYTFTITGEIDFGDYYGTCPINDSFTGNADPKGGGPPGPPGGDPWEPPDPPPGGDDDDDGGGGGGPGD